MEEKGSRGRGRQVDDWVGVLDVGTEQVWVLQ